ncbi:hypothetical protein D9611_014205 [Ephemerocybe angulata]|uniref:Potassium channel domain-containing protein n=1 Tax=Ephemerocybe angulata TaxID=980116 RepID=A0A8H5CAE0_9AGAR|nr:hypothetical protein D9611_014205 [Tulosesus angulatus]
MVGISSIRKRLNDALPPSEVEGGIPTYRTLPILAGIIVPFSILLQIPSLTGRWYTRTDEHHKIIDSRRNTTLLKAALIIALICAVFANVCLVIRYLERGIKPMTILAIIFLTAHDLISTITVIVFGVQHRFEDGVTYGQAFWWAVCSVIISIITSVTLIIDFVRTPNFAKSGSGLTKKQRGLVIIIMVLLIYIGFVTSIETVGLGDIHPTSAGSKVFTMFYVTFGILNLGLAVSAAREVLLEGVVVSLKNAIHNIQQKDRKRRVRAQWKRSVEYRLRAQGLPVWVDLPPGSTPSFWSGGLRGAMHRLRGSFNRTVHDPSYEDPGVYIRGCKRRRLNLEALEKEELEAAAMEAGAPLADLLLPGALEWNHLVPTPDSREARLLLTQPPLTYVRFGAMSRLLASSVLALVYGEQAPHIRNEGDLEDISISADEGGNTSVRTSKPLIPFKLDPATLSAMLRREAKTAFYVRLSSALALWLTFWMVGAAIFSKTESWSFGTAVYFCFVVFTTLGYGDYAPQTAAGRAIFVVWALLGIATMTILLSILTEAYSTRYKRAVQSEVIQKGAYDDVSRQSTSTSLELSTFSRAPTVVGKPRTVNFEGAESERGHQISGIPRIDMPNQPATVEPWQARHAVSSGVQLPGAVLRHVHGTRELVQAAIVVAEEEAPSPDEATGPAGMMNTGGDSASQLQLQVILGHIDRRLLALTNLVNNVPEEPPRINHEDPS